VLYVSQNYTGVSGGQKTNTPKRIWVTFPSCWSQDSAGGKSQGESKRYLAEGFLQCLTFSATKWSNNSTQWWRRGASGQSKNFLFIFSPIIKMPQEQGISLSGWLPEHSFKQFVPSRWGLTLLLYPLSLSQSSLHNWGH